MPGKYNSDIENENEKFEKELNAKLAREEKLEEKYSQITAREQKQKKQKSAARGGTLAGQMARMRLRKFYVRSKRKPKIKIVDKTKK